MKNLQKVFIVSLLIIVAVIVIGGGVYYYSKIKQSLPVSKSQKIIPVPLERYLDVINKISFLYPQGSKFLAVSMSNFQFPISAVGLASDYGETFDVSFFMNWPFGEKNTDCKERSNFASDTMRQKDIDGKTAWIYDGRHLAPGSSATDRAYVMTINDTCILVSGFVDLTIPDSIIRMQDIEKIWSTAHSDQLFQWLEQNIIPSINIEVQQLSYSGDATHLTYRNGSLYSFTILRSNNLKYLNTVKFPNGSGYRDNFTGPGNTFIMISYSQFDRIGTTTDANLQYSLNSVKQFIVSKNPITQDIIDTTLNGVPAKMAEYTYIDPSSKASTTQTTLLVYRGNIMYQIDFIAPSNEDQKNLQPLISEIIESFNIVKPVDRF